MQSDEVLDTPASYDVLTSEPALTTGRVIDVRTDVVAFPGGDSATRDIVVHPGAVGIIAVDAEDRVLLIQQYRHPVRRLLWEPPAGLLDEVGEDPLHTAQRELHEEAHYEADDWRVLVDGFTSPGMTDEAVRIYLARGLRRSRRPRHEAEHEERGMPVRWLPLDAAVEAVLAGRLHNPLCVMGVLAAAHARLSGYAALRRADAPWPEMSDWPGSHAASS